MREMTGSFSAAIEPKLRCVRERSTDRVTGGSSTRPERQATVKDMEALAGTYVTDFCFALQRLS